MGTPAPEKEYLLDQEALDKPEEEETQAAKAEEDEHDERSRATSMATGNSETPEQAKEASGGQAQPSALLGKESYEGTTIVLVVQFRPVTQSGQPREIWLSAQNGVDNEKDFPLFRRCTEDQLDGPWPPLIQCLLDDLARELPARKKRQEPKPVTRPAPKGPTPSAGNARQHPPAQKAKTSVQAAKSTPPPLPTTSSKPIPQKGLDMADLFDGLEED
jgi:hypothetical protein